MTIFLGVALSRGAGAQLELLALCGYFHLLYFGNWAF